VRFFDEEKDPATRAALREWDGPARGQSRNIEAVLEALRDAGIELDAHTADRAADSMRR
jgi:hypothetical protein